MMQRPRSGLLFLMMLPMLLFFGAPLRAQQGGGVTVTVLGQLDMGQVIDGTTVTIQPSDSRAGRFVVGGPVNARIRLHFALPSSLSTGTTTVPITFGATAAAWSTQNQVAGSTAFNPATDTDVIMPSSRQFYVWLGGTLAPGSQQQAGSYNGSISLTATKQ